MNLNEEANFSEEDKIVHVVGFGKRLGAYILDVFILGIIMLPLAFCGSFMVTALFGTNPESTSLVSLGLNCIIFLLGVAYFVGFWATKGQTPGKMALGIKVIDVQGYSVSWGKAFLRYIGYIVSAMVFHLGFVWISFDAKRQGWHDKLASTYVVPQDTEFSPTESVTFKPTDPDNAWIWVALWAVSWLIVIIVVPIVVIGLLLLLGPVIGDVFSGIVSGLEATPGPQ